MSIIDKVSPKILLPCFSLEPIMSARILALLVVLSLLQACSRAQSLDEPPDSVISAVPVRVAPVELRAGTEVLRFASVARVRQRANLTFQVAGVIAEREVEIGQEVAQGQVLVRLYNPQLLPARDAAQARLDQLHSELKQARRDLERTQTLNEEGVLPIRDLEQQRSRVEGLESALANARANLEQAEQLSRESSLRAPFAGHIEEVLLEPGEFVQAGQPVLRLAAREGLETEVQVPAHLLTGLNVGEVVPVWSTLSGEQFEGVVSEIAMGSSGSGALYPVLVSLSGPALSTLRTGAALEVGINRQRAEQLLIPLNAVMRSAEGLTVFRVVGDRVSRVPITVGQIQGDYVVVEQGPLSQHDAVVYAGLTRLAEGDRVEVLR